MDTPPGSRSGSPTGDSSQSAAPAASLFAADDAAGMAIEESSTGGKTLEDMFAAQAALIINVSMPQTTKSLKQQADRLKQSALLSCILTQLKTILNYIGIGWQAAWMML